MNKVIKSGHLKGSYRCKFKREHDIPLEHGKRKENVYDKAALIKDIIKEGIYHGIDEDKIKERLVEGYKKLDYPTEETSRIHAMDAFKQIMRYLTSDCRKPIKSKAQTIDIFGLCQVEVRPDFVFKGYRVFERTMKQGRKTVKYSSYEPYIEVVKLCCKLPDVTMTGKNKDSGAMQNLELYSMLKYARNYITEEDTNINVGASYYFLRKNNDKALTDEFDEEFFNNKGAGNIVSLWEAHHMMESEEGIRDFSPQAIAMDENFEPQFRTFIEGEEICDKNTCEKCSMYHMCNFTKAPVVLEKERRQKSLCDLVLSDEQQNAIDFRRGIARINAGAGAGKTLVTALRIANMLDEGILPEEIILLTFTNTSAEEMRERIRLYVEDIGCDTDMDKLTCTTFHSFGDKIIKDNFEELGFSQKPKLMDAVEQAKIIAELLKETIVPGLDYRNFKSHMPAVMGALPMAQRAFSVIKKAQLSRGDENKLKLLLEDYSAFIEKKEGYTVLLELYEKYDEILRERNLIEYADQELLVMELLSKNPYYFEDYGYKHIMVDEYQDSSPIAFELLKALIDTPDFESFMVVGDDSQSIFSFQGSSPEYIIQFYEKLEVENGKDFYLLENHRSTPQIIDFANDINNRNANRVEKDLIATRETGVPVTVRQFWKKQDEENYIVDLIKEKHKHGIAYEDIAYIAFSRKELLKMGTILTEEGIPWVLLNPEPTLQNSRVLAAIALMKFMRDSSDTSSAFSYLNAISDNTLLNYPVDNIMNEISKLHEKLEYILEVSDNGGKNILKGMLERLDMEDEIYVGFLKKLLQHETVEEIIQYAHDFADYGDKETEKREKNYPGVVLTTAHSSKGKEWKVVINGISKYHDKNLKADEMEEKRRLFFVSSTRARDELFITGQSVAYGDKENHVYNKFLKEAFETLGMEFHIINPYDVEKELKKKRKTA